MKYSLIKILIISIVLITICNCKAPKIISRQDLIFKGPISSNQNPELVSNENRESKDSANFIIVTGKYISGSKHVTIRQDNETKLYHWRQYYPNGNLKEGGILTKDNWICIGKWKYYSESGKLDSIADYGKKFKITYADAMAIALKYGFQMPDFEVDLVKYENTLYWQIRKWHMKTGDGFSETILISTTKPKVIKPEEEEEKHY